MENQFILYYLLNQNLSKTQHECDEIADAAKQE